MLPILLPARAFGSILYGLRLRLSVFGLLGSGEGSAGRAVHASLVPLNLTLPACAVGDPRCCTPFALDLSHFRLRPALYDPARAIAAGYMLRNRHGGN